MGSNFGFEFFDEDDLVLEGFCAEDPGVTGVADDANEVDGVLGLDFCTGGPYFVVKFICRRSICGSRMEEMAFVASMRGGLT